MIVSRVTVGDFDECKSTEHNDCADNAICYNIEGSYTCACQDNFHDLSGPDSLPGRVCSGKYTQWAKNGENSAIINRIFFLIFFAIFGPRFIRKGFNKG